MKKTLLFYILIFVLSALTLSAILPYPIFSNYTNINEQNAFEINNYQETEIKNDFSINPQILDLEFETINQLLPDKFEIIDLQTEETLFVTRLGGNFHADIIFDNKSKSLLHEICQGWSYNRRPVLVKLNENAYLPASLICYPHGYQNHFCLYFKNSKTHGTKKEDSKSQKVIEKAFSLGEKFIESI